MEAGWWSPSLSASPPPPPRAPSHPCLRCRGRLPPLHHAASHSCLSHPHPHHDGWSVGGGGGACGEEEESTGGALRERELRSLHRTVPALRRRELDTRAIKHHFYPEGGWGWIVCGAAFLAHLLSTGLQLAYGALHIYAVRHLGERAADHVVWAGALCVGVSRAASAVAAGGGARRHSPRLAALLGGLLLPLACLFTSFATQLHQALLSYGVVLGVGCGLVRESAGLMLGAYFRRRRQFVELVAHAGGGVGIALFSVCYKEAVGKLGWRLGLQAVTGALVLGFFLSAVYRSASLYHPQRRAIQHLKNQRRKVKEKKSHARPKPPALDLSPLRSRPARMLLLAAAVAAFGLYTPVFYLALQGYREGLEDSALVLLQTFLGFAAVLGCAGFGLVLVRPSAQCLVSKQYLCQTALLGIGVSMLALISVQGYHGYVLFAWMYGLCLGGFLYSIKMLTMERVRARHFAKVWGYVQGAEAIPVIVGVPMTGYINQYAARAGYYFSFAATVAAAFLLFFVGFSKREPGESIHSAGNATAATISNGECACPGASPPRYEPPPPPAAWCSCATVAGAGYCSWTPPAPMSCHARLPKSLSFATPLDRAGTGYCSAPPYWADCGCGCHWRRRSVPAPGLRPSKSVPEGLARRDGSGTWARGGSCRASCHRHRREHQFIEQITTSV